MKARIKETGEIIEVESLYSVTYSRLDCNGKIAEEYDEDELEFLNKEENKYWQDVRERAAIAAMQGILSCGEGAFSYQGITDEIAKAAVDYADSLITELKRKVSYESTREIVSK